MANTDIIAAFLDTINNNANANYQNANYIVNQYFSADDGAGHPLVAVTEHGAAVGPAFHGGVKIKKFFRRLFNAFPDNRRKAKGDPTTNDWAPYRRHDSVVYGRVR